MAHNIQVIITEVDLMDKFSAELGAFKYLVLSQNKALIPLVHDLHDRIVELVHADNFDGHRCFIYLGNCVEMFLKGISSHGQVAYIETEYFGGTGTQSAILFENQRNVLGPLTMETKWNSIKESYETFPKGKGPINVVLSRMNVEVLGGKIDEFDALGLSHYRSNESILEKSTVTE